MRPKARRPNAYQRARHALVLCGILTLLPLDLALGQGFRGLGSHSLLIHPDPGLGFAWHGDGSRENEAHLSLLPPHLGPSGLGHQRRSQDLLGDRSLSLFEGGQISAEEALQRMVRERVGSFFGIHSQKEESGAILLSFHVAGVPLCFFGVRGTALASRELVALGTVPRVRELSGLTLRQDWPSQDKTTVFAAETLGRSYGWLYEPQGTPQRCYALRDGGLRPAWRLSMLTGHEAYRVVADESQIYAVEPAFIHAAGTARVYPYDSVTTPSLVTEALTGLKGDGYLASEFFETVVSSGANQATSLNHNFSFDVTSLPFEETSVFVNATKQLQFFQSLGFSWYGPKPLLLQMNRTGMANNARFLPPNSTSTLPVIEIGTGDGVILKNLGTDASVVSHELGHYAIYRAVTKTSGESLVLHEGLADYFEAARAQDPCLGNSVCPEGSNACFLESKCLRTAENTFEFEDADWQSWLSAAGQYTHLHGQVFSGLLWDLRLKAPSGPKVFDALVMRTISYLPPEAQFEDLLTYLLVTDQDLNNGVHRQIIRDTAEERGLGSFLTAPNSGEKVEIVNKSGTYSEPKSRGSGRSARGGGKVKACGVLGTKNAGSFSWIGLALCMIPVLQVFFLSLLKNKKH